MTNSLADRIYLDNAATSFPKPEPVYAAVDRFLRNNGTAFARGASSLATESAELVSRCRNRIARILGARSHQEIAFTFNCTDSLNLLLRGLLSQHDRVVTTTLEHNSVLRPLNQLQKEFDLEVIRVNFDRETGVVSEAEFLEALAYGDTKLVVLNHASNVTGVVQPIESLCRIAHDAGAMTLLDAAQTAGHFPFSVTDLNVDFLATAGHKGLLGPLGTGVLYVREGLEKKIRPVRCGGTGTMSESVIQPTAMPSLFESGNLNMPGIAGLDAATEWLLEQEITAVHNSIQHHLTILRKQLISTPGIQVHCAGSNADNTGIVSFTIDEMDSREAATILDQSFQIQCRAGFHCAPLVHERLDTESQGGSLRFSPGPFTQTRDVEAAANAVLQLSASM